MSAPEPTAEHIAEARALRPEGRPDEYEQWCQTHEGTDQDWHDWCVARALAAREARGFERGRAAGPAPYVDPLADAAGNRHHKDGSRCTDPNCRRAHALPAVLFTLSSCLYPEPR